MKINFCVNIIMINFFVFSNRLFVCLKDNINEEKLHVAKNVILDKMYYSILPFCVGTSFIYV